MLRVPKDMEPFRLVYRGMIGDEHNGYFAIPKRKMVIIASSDDLEWEHLSISLTNRTPTWGEMEHFKRLFFDPDDTCMQLHVPVSDHKNFHPFCLHIWRPKLIEIPRPPLNYV